MNEGQKREQNESLAAGLELLMIARQVRERCGKVCARRKADKQSIDFWHPLEGEQEASGC